MDFDENYIRNMISQSLQFGDEDFDLIMGGLRHAQTYVRDKDEYRDRKDELVAQGLSTEFIFNCELIGRNDIEHIYKKDVPTVVELVSEIGPPKIVTATNITIDRWTGHQGVTLANELCKVKEELLEEGHDLSLLEPGIVKAKMGPYSIIDNFRCPQVESHVDIDMIAIYKRTYAEFLDSVIQNGENILYIEGDFGAAGMRRLDHVADCLYFDEGQMLRSKNNRKLNSTQGEDFYYDIDDVAWKEKVASYTVVVHNFLFGDLYDDLKEIQKGNKKMNLIGMGMFPDVSDTEIYIPQKKQAFLESFSIEETKANKYGLQVLYEGPFMYAVYIDHGRYWDFKPHSYDIMIPFVDLNTWRERRCFRAFRHFGVCISGPLKVLYDMKYLFPCGTVDYRKIKNEEIVVGDKTIHLAGIPDGNIMLLNGMPIDFEDNTRPYWLRRHMLKMAGVIFEDGDSDEMNYQIIDSCALYDCVVPLEEYELLQEIKEKPIKPYIEVKGVGWNPVIRKLVYDPYSTSIATPYDSTQDDSVKIRISVLEEDGKMRLVEDSLGTFSLFTNVSYSKECEYQEDEFLEDKDNPGSLLIDIEQDEEILRLLK